MSNPHTIPTKYVTQMPKTPIAIGLDRINQLFDAHEKGDINLHTFHLGVSIEAAKLYTKGYDSGRSDANDVVRVAETRWNVARAKVLELVGKATPKPHPAFPPMVYYIAPPNTFGERPDPNT